jgi:hypothetical protein
VIGDAVKVMRIATGEETEELPDSAKSVAAELGSRGGKARAAKMTPQRRAAVGAIQVHDYRSRHLSIACCYNSN